MARRWVSGLAALVLVGLIGGSATAQTPEKPPSALERPPVWRNLERFASEAELLRYIRDVQRLTRVGRRVIGIESGGLAVPPPPSPPPAAVQAGAADGVVVTGTQVQRQDFEAISPVAGDPTSITNVQTQGVDEGGIVKMVGRFLVILQDGRLFVTDTRPNGEPGLALTGRTNVYRNPGADTWYDELLISGNRILVTGYSYRESASEITVFTINDAGVLTREATYYISSNDYYDTENYSTRLVNGNLVIYTPLEAWRLDPERPLRWPLVRRWLRDTEHRAETSAGRRLFEARDIYKPIQATRAPVVHSVSVCPLGELRSGDELECRTTAFVGPPDREFFVSTSDIFLWVSANHWMDREAAPCPPAASAGRDAYAVDAALFQVPLSGAAPRALHTRGEPTNQFALDATGTEFRALLGWNTSHCNQREGAELRYFHAPLSSLSAAPGRAPANSFTAVPGLNTTRYEVRFADTHLVYGGRDGGSYPPQEGEEARTARIVAVPTARPTAAVQLDAPHDILRIERVGGAIALTGYRDAVGLSLSLLDLGQRPRIVSTRVLTGRFEAENRSHAFNSLVGVDGAGVIGLPTVTRTKEAGRWVWRSDASDLSFISVDAAGRLGPLGELNAYRNAVHAGYRCEVSCVDWYGNSRALFIGSRILALSGTELIEGAVVDGRMVERGRLNLSAPPPGS